MLRNIHLDHLSVGVLVCRSVGLSVRKMYCGKTADWIRMPFGVVSAVGRGMGVLDGVVIEEGAGAVLGVNLGRLIVTNGAFATRLFSNYFEDLLPTATEICS